MSAGIGGNADGLSTDIYANAVAVSAFNGGGVCVPILSVDATVAANAMTLTLYPCVLSFRSSSLTTGTTVYRKVNTAITTVISSGSTGGTFSGVQSDIILLAIDNAGTVELAWTNIYNGTAFDEMGLISTTAEGGAGGADSAGTIYSTTARSNVAYRVVGLIRSTQATAGTWATAPSLKQGMGGQALTAFSSLGYGQTWQDVSGSRALSTTYYNTTGKPIIVHFRLATTTAASCTTQITIAGSILSGDTITTSGAGLHLNVVVPPNASYAITISGSGTINQWYELR
jgi:hypothetical protein